MKLFDFLKNATAVCIIVIILIGSIFIAIPPDPDSYFGGSVLKLNLLKSTPSPKIVVVGGSSVAFGIDSVLMEKEHGRPVINDGLNAGLSMLPLEELKDYIGAGDIIIVSIEYVIFTFYADGNPQEISDWIEYAPERIKYLPEPVAQAPSTLGIMLQRKVNRSINYYLYNRSLEPIRGIYQGSDFNSHGDFIGHLKTDYIPPKIDPGAYPINPSEKITNYLIEFKEYASTKGATVFFESQPNRRTNCKATPEQRIKRFYKDLQEETGIIVLTNMDQLCLPDKYFFDTAYHLNAVGREIRTKRLINNLKIVLEISAAP